MFVLGVEGVLLMLHVEQVKGQFFDFLEQPGVHLADGDAVGLNVAGGGDAGEVLVPVDVGFHVFERWQIIVVGNAIQRTTDVWRRTVTSAPQVESARVTELLLRTAA